MATEVTLPQLGESVTEGTITAWLVEVGDAVEADQPLFELSSDKIDTEVPSPTAGTITEIKVEVDETVDVGTVVALIGESDEAGDGGGDDDGGDGGDGEAEASTEEPEQPAEEAGDESAAESAAEPAAESAAEEPEPASAPEAGGGDQPAVADTMYERADADEPEAAKPEPAAGGEEKGSTGEGLLASPIVRRMVAENDLTLDDIPATGDGGRVTREDVEAYLEQQGGGEASAQAPKAAASDQAPPAEPAAQAKPKATPQPERRTSLEAGERERVEKLPRIRQRIAAKMRESLESAAQLTTVQEADVTDIMRLRGQTKETFAEREGVSLSPFIFLARAAVLALRKPEHENVSAQADWQAGQVKYHDYVNLGIAVDTERGLLVPNVKRADDLTLPALAREIAAAADKARGKGKLEMSDIEGGTFTVTNTGSRGVLIDTPILNYPEVAILGTGVIKKRPVVTDDDAIAIRSMVYLCLTYDHMLLDGADAARFVTDVKGIVETHDWAQEIGY